jgi:hypothetical protein
MNGVAAKRGDDRLLETVRSGRLLWTLDVALAVEPDPTAPGGPSTLADVVSVASCPGAVPEIVQPAWPPAGTPPLQTLCVGAVAVHVKELAYVAEVAATVAPGGVSSVTEIGETAPVARG